ncbi:MAG TPA: type VI secretion system baseplate subunit TssG [Bryobacteraceae bacterium]|jgi:type VI secretion system protein ImpH|nr:type VI secretion system baseplate subunit TssG [Bryobacteraceae bacterium]
MASQSRQPDSALIPERLRERAVDFGFFQAVRLLQRACGSREPIGSFLPPAEEPVRLGVHPSLTFPPGEIQSLEERPEGPPKMSVNFFGLTGHSGVMPTIYTELIVERLFNRDRTLRDFLDIFNHRAISLLYRAWEKYRFPVSYERGGEDRFTGYLLDLIGLGTRGLQNRQAVADQVLIGYEGLFAQFPRSTTAFRQILADYFEVPVEVVPFAGTWRPLDSGSRTCLAEGRTRSEQLGIGIVLGDEVWDQESVVRIRLGPMTVEQYKQFLPDGTAYEPLKSMAKFFCGEDLDVEVQLILKREEAPRFALDSEEAPPTRLGWFSWMFTRPLDRDPDETILRLWDDR